MNRRRVPFGYYSGVLLGAAVRALVARRGCPEVLNILGLGQAS